MSTKSVLIAFGFCLLSLEGLRAQPVDIGSDSRAKAQLLGPYMPAIRQIVFVTHSRRRGEHYAYTEALSDAYSNDNERYMKWHAWDPGSKLCLLTVNDDCTTKTEILLDSPDGMIRDPDVSFDGKKILFSWKKSDRNHDYHLFEMDVESRDIRQLTFGLGHADFEGCYLPNGDIIFSSTRNVSTVDCFVQESCNLFTCDKDGKYMRRLGFDQVHTNYPTVTPDGRIIYTRWEYNDRGQYWPQNLFQMKPDGTAQTALYGNNSWFPTSMLHSRAIPNSHGKVMFIVAGHGTPQSGRLAIVDPTIASQEEAGVTFLAPVKPAANQSKEPNFAKKDAQQWKYPFPLDESNFLVSFKQVPESKRAPDTHYNLVFMNADGRYVVLASDPDTSCYHPVLLAPRVAPQLPASTVDYRKNTGVFTMENIYHGPGLANVPKGTITKLRVVALKYRATVVGGNGNRGPAGGGGVKTPVGARNTTWDAKTVLGEAEVYSDGSAAFEVPARTPVYFQAIDANGHVAQTMRSWSTLQPGETFSCIGCHDSRLEAPPITARSIASQKGPQPLSPFYDVPADTGFSYTKIIQPIWDKRCVSCHNASTTNGLDLSENPRITGRGRRDRLQYALSYHNLVSLNQTTAKHLDFDGRNDVVTKYLNWLSPQSIPPLLPPYTAGSAKSPLFQMVANHNPPVDISREELDKIACWIDLLVPHDGEYTESMSKDDQAAYRVKLNKRKAWEAVEEANIASYISSMQPARNDRSPPNRGGNRKGPK